MSAASTQCSRCKRNTATPFGGTAVCLHCAGVRALALDLDDEVDSLDPTAAITGSPPRDRSGLPERIGPYEIVDELGRGGMARVFAARQPRLDRLVALKVLGTGPSNEALEQRFLREIQTVARLRHPHIVAIHDSGRADGYVYFAMDYIEGGDFAQRLRVHPLPARTIAVLLEKIAAALAYAHGEGVLHRDLKPSNILLDGDEPRLADFGLAAQMEAGGDLTVASAVLGTPHYLAPEAVKFGSAALSAASDLYALGVILYEALAGRTPFAGASSAELPALLQNSEPPPLRLLAPGTPRDLETICLKCLERDPARRYASTAAFAADLRHFLAGESIVARPPGALQRFHRFSRKHRTLLAVTGGTGAALAAGIAVSTALAIRATRAEHRAATEAATATALAEFLQHDLLLQVTPGAQPDRDLKLRTVLEEAAKKIEGRFSGQPVVEAALRETLGATYHSLGEYATAQTQFERALELARRAQPDSPVVWRLMNELGATLAARTKYPAAAALVAAALVQQRAALGPKHADTVATMATLALIYHRQDKLPLAEQLEREVLALRQKHLGRNHPDTLTAMNQLAVMFMDLGKFDDAAALFRETYDLRLVHLGAENPGTLQTRNELAMSEWALRRFDIAEPLLRENLVTCRRVLGETHLQTLESTSNLATVLREQKKWDESAALYEKVLADIRRTLGEDHHEFMRNLCFLALVYRSQARFPEAQTKLEQAREVGKRVLSAKHPEVLSAGDLLGSVLLAQSKFAEAEPVLREALAGHLDGDNRPGAVNITRCRLGASLLGLRRFDEAEQLMLAGYEGLRGEFDRLMPYQQGVLRDTIGWLAKLYVDRGQPEKAATWQALLNQATAKR